VSHSKEREEKICLNCNADLNGRFCHLCGQENLVPKESVWGLISHFFYDITHFDGKFFSTVKYLIAKPGFLPKEYLRGRRASYLNPIRMYVFSSAIFFAIFFSMFSVKNMNLGLEVGSNGADSTNSNKQKKQVALQKAKNVEDSIKVEAYFGALEHGYKGDIKKDLGMENDFDKVDSSIINKQLALRNAKTLEDSIRIETSYATIPSIDNKKPKNQGQLNLGFGSKFDTKKQYDSFQNAMPVSLRDNWFKGRIIYRNIELTNKYKDQPKQFLKDLLDKFIHTFPYLLFVSLPLYALFLKLLYIRRNQYYYVNHGIFLIYLYIFTFLLLLVYFSLMELYKVWETGWIWFLATAIFLYGIYYTLKSMRNFYGQGWGKTILKFFLFNIMAFISLIILFSLFFILTVFRV